MVKENRLAENLKHYQSQRHQTLAEFAEELMIPKSTLQSLLKDGNTTLDTLVRIQTALEVSLDELVYGENWVLRKTAEENALKQMAWYVEMPTEKKEKFKLCLHEMLMLMEYEDE